MGDPGATSPSVVLVPHTHWDREWYEPFQRFRLRLVDLLDDVVTRAREQPGFRFTLDGQMAAVEDYLEVRPDQREHVRELVQQEQFAIGPWRVLLDEFLCSGENIIRNLELGLAQAAEFGTPMAIGYLPDMFGHCAQMPQLLTGAGLRHACVWRGVPASVDRHAFRWVAPDGTGLRTEYLPGGYGNAADLFDGRPESVGGLLADRVALWRNWFGDDDFLAMYGTDHAAPLPSLMTRVAELQAAAGRGEGADLRLATLAEYVLAFNPDEQGLPEVTGELHSHARANILPGVISVRWHLKEAMARAERMVERYAEPLAALWSPDWPQAYLDLAWQRLVDSSCHDSVTGCGVDETALQVAARIAEAEHAGQAVRDRTTARLAARVPRGAALVVNPSPHERLGFVELEAPAAAVGARVAVRAAGGGLYPAQELARPEPPLAEEEGRRLLAMVPVPALGWTAVRTEPLGDDVRDPGEDVQDLGDAVQDLGDDVIVDDEPLEPLLRNRSLVVRVRRDGSLRVEAADGTVLDGVGRLVDGGDCGDSYNYGPPAHDELVSEPSAVEVRVLERGPLRGAVEVVRTYDLPASLGEGGHRSSRLEPVRVAMRVELRALEPFVRLHLRWENRSSDHRLRLHVPLGRPSDTSDAEGQLAVVHRGRTAEGGPSGEYPIPTFPASGFVDAGGAGVLLTRASEYELVRGEAGDELAITLLRAIGWLSRDVHPYRSEPAGPQLATPAAQVLGPAEARLAVLPHNGSWQDAGLVAASETYRYDVVTRAGTGEDGGALTSGAGLAVEGAGATLSSLRRRGEWLELRVVAERDTPVTARVSGGVERARWCDLLGRAGEALSVADGGVEVPLRPWQIATIQIDVGGGLG